MPPYNAAGEAWRCARLLSACHEVIIKLFDQKFGEFYE
jgi:hypothetical protein